LDASGLHCKNSGGDAQPPVRPTWAAVTLPPDHQAGRKWP